MKLYEHSGVLFISLNPAEHVSVTLPGSMLDEIQKSGKSRDETFLFFAEEKGSLLKIGREEYEILKGFAPRSPFDEQLKQLISAHFLAE